MSKIIITSNGKTREIDLTSVIEITNNLENILRKRKNVSDRRYVEYSVEVTEKMRHLNKDQLRYLIANFLGLLTRYADLYQRILDNPEEECRKIMEYGQVYNKSGM